jgi:hypothetical protein
VRRFVRHGQLSLGLELVFWGDAGFAISVGNGGDACSIVHCFSVVDPVTGQAFPVTLWAEIKLCWNIVARRVVSLYRGTFLDGQFGRLRPWYPVREASVLKGWLIRWQWPEKA